MRIKLVFSENLGVEKTWVRTKLGYGENLGLENLGGGQNLGAAKIWVLTNLGRIKLVCGCGKTQLWKKLGFRQN